jgi:hypothetical protein
VGTLCIARNTFLDRAIDFLELAALANMLREWYGLRAASGGAQSGRVWCEARIYAFPQIATERIRQAISARLPDSDVQASAADELTVVGPARAADAPADLRVWREVLAEPLVQNACVLLRLTISGPVVRVNGAAGDATQTFVLCGAPASGIFLLKAMWGLRKDESMGLVYRLAPWDAEAKLLEAFETYLGECRAGRAATAAVAAIQAFGEKGKQLFLARRDERKVMWLVRQKVEMPDDRGPAAFARRVGLPLVGGLGLIAVPVALQAEFPLVFICLLAAGYLLWVAARIAWRKFIRVRSYYRGMRAALGKLYSKPAEYQVIDLSSDHTPTLLKASAELAALGARHVCDVRIDTAKSVLDGNRVFAIGDTTASLGLLRKTEKLLFFPAKPIVIFATRFADGRRHYTMNKPIYRKRSRPQVTARCLPDEGGIDEVYARHRRHVDRLVAAGGVPIPPATTSQQIFDRMRAEHEEGREAWQRSPYSWGDALHNAFKVCRREYLSD